MPLCDRRGTPSLSTRVRLCNHSRNLSLSNSTSSHLQQQSNSSSQLGQQPAQRSRVCGSCSSAPGLIGWKKYRVSGEKRPPHRRAAYARRLPHSKWLSALEQSVGHRAPPLTQSS